jgi:hypothetical protein
MSDLNALKNRDPEEVARILSMISNSLIPNPGIEESARRKVLDPEFVRSMLTEIRKKLRIPESDNSVKAQSRIYAFLSEEISKAALANTDMERIKTRLGDKGELHPSQYQVTFAPRFELLEALGMRRPHIIEAVVHPDQSTHLRAKTTLQDPQCTISIKSVLNNKTEDNFSVIVLSTREGQVQEVLCAFRAYESEVNLKNLYAPLDVVRSFVETYGLSFRIGQVISKFMHNEVLKFDEFSPILDQSDQALDKLKPIEGKRGDHYLPLIIHGTSNIRGVGTEVWDEIYLAFIIDMTKYVATLRKHHVQLPPESSWRFSQI